MIASTASRKSSRVSPAWPSWRRLTVLVSLLLLGWAALLPAGRSPQWWHYAVAALVIAAFAGSWHGQHVSTAVSRWTPMAWHNRRQRSHRASGHSRQPGNTGAAPAEQPSTPSRPALQARIVIHLRPHPHTLTAPGDHSDQLPWDFITAWLDRYGVRADTLTVCSVTGTPTASGLRSDSAPLLGGRNTQHRDTWLSYTLRAENNVGALTARQTTLGTVVETDADEGSAQPRRAALADTVARRLIAELRERGWLATLSDADRLPRFVPPGVGVRRETWTGTEYSDGFRAVYAVDPAALSEVLESLTALNTKATWVAITIRSCGRQPATAEAIVGTLTTTRPSRQPLAGLDGFHGLHRRIMPALGAAGLDAGAGVELPAAEIASSALAELVWPTAAIGVPIGYNRARQPVYLGLASPEPVRVTVTGTRQFHVAIIARLALSGQPVALYTSDPRQWAALANHAAPQQFSMRPAIPPAESIVVSDGSSDAPTGAMAVTLRRPQSAQAPATTIVITQDSGHPDLFYITTAHGRQWLSTRIP